MKKIVVAVALLAVSSASAHAARITHHGSKKPVHQAVHAERHVAPKARAAVPADDAPAPSSPAMTLPYDAFRG